MINFRTGSHKLLIYISAFFLLAVSAFFLTKNSCAAGPYFYSCILTSVTPTPVVTGAVTPTASVTANITPTPIISPVVTITVTLTPTLITPTPTSTPAVNGTCVVGGTTINQGEGICDEKTNLVSQCDGNNRMTQKPNYCGTGQVCRSQTGSFQIKCEAACQLKMGTGARTKADLVVLAEDYGSYVEFLTAVDKAVVALNKTNLGPARLGKLNLWAWLDLNQTYFQGFNCPTANGVNVACWDHTKAFSIAAAKCGGDSYLVFNNDTHRTGTIGGISIWGGTYIYNFALDQPTVPHELGHSLTGLMDEYSFGIAAPPGSPAGINCSELPAQNETAPCPKWASRFPNVGCYQRCGYTNFYRPEQRSIMDRGGTGAVYDFNDPSLVDGWDEMLKLFQ